MFEILNQIFIEIYFSNILWSFFNFIKYKDLELR